MEQFYVTLRSNSSYAYYGRQLVSHYKTKLAREVHVNVGEWEVGLAELIYPITFWMELSRSVNRSTINGVTWTEEYQPANTKAPRS